MKERGILYSAPMVRAKRAGLKTQTRRLVHPQPVWKEQGGGYAAGWFVEGRKYPDGLGAWPTETLGAQILSSFGCPYGARGDRLWTRETWRCRWRFDHLPPREVPTGSPIRYEADGLAPPGGGGAGPGWGRIRQSIFMPRWASRLVDELVAVRVERLQDITEADAKAEGAQPVPLRRGEPGCWWTFDPTGKGPPPGRTARAAYSSGWEWLHGPGSWALNPWVWVLTTRPVS